MGTFDASDAEILKDAFKDALKEYGVATTSSSSTTTSESPTGTPPPGSKSSFDQFVEILGKGSSRAASLAKGLKNIIKNQAAQEQKLLTYRKSQLAYFFEAKKTIGGIATVAELGEERAVGLAKLELDTYRKLMIAGSDASKSALKFADGTMKGFDPMIAFFKNGYDVAVTFDEVFNEVASNTAMAAKAMGESSQKTQESVAFFRRTLGLSAEETADIIRRQFVFTGEVSEDVLGQIGTTSIALMRETGLGANQIKDDLLKIITDVDLFGNIGVKSAGRISAALNTLGVDFTTFKRLTGQIISLFESIII